MEVEGLDFLVDDVLRLIVELLDPVAHFNLVLTSKTFSARLRYKSIRIKPGDYFFVCGRSLAIHVAEWAASEKVFTLDLNSLLTGVGSSQNLETIKAVFTQETNQHLFSKYPFLMAAFTRSLQIERDLGGLARFPISSIVAQAAASVGDLEALKFLSTTKISFDSLLFCKSLLGRNYACSKFLYERTWRRWNDFIGTGYDRSTWGFIADMDVPLALESIETLRKLRNFEAEERWPEYYTVPFTLYPLYLYSVRNLDLLRYFLANHRASIAPQALGLFLESVNTWRAGSAELILEAFPEITKGFSPFLIWQTLQRSQPTRNHLKTDLEATMRLLQGLGLSFTLECRDAYRWAHASIAASVVLPHILPTTKDLLCFLRNSFATMGRYQSYEPFQQFTLLPVEITLDEYVTAMKYGIQGLCSLQPMQAYSSSVPTPEIRAKFLATLKEAEDHGTLKVIQPKLDHIDWLLSHGATMIEETLIYLIRSIFGRNQPPTIAHVIRRHLFAFFENRVQGRGFQFPGLCWELLAKPSLDLCAWLLMYNAPMTRKFLEKAHRIIVSPHRNQELRDQLRKVLEMIRRWKESQTL